MREKSICHSLFDFHLYAGLIEFTTLATRLSLHLISLLLSWMTRNKHFVVLMDTLSCILSHWIQSIRRKKTSYLIWNTWNKTFFIQHCYDIPKTQTKPWKTFWKWRIFIPFTRIFHYYRQHILFARHGNGLRAQSILIWFASRRVTLECALRTKSAHFCSCARTKLHKFKMEIEMVSVHVCPE